MLKSIRWSLQLWHAFILLLVLAGFGTTLYYRIQLSRHQEIDAELSSIAHFLAPELHPRQPQFQPPPRRERPGDPEGPPGDLFFDDLRPDPEPPPLAANFPPGNKPDQAPQITDSLRRRFKSEARAGAYYVIWKHDGTRLGASPGAPEVPYPGAFSDPPPAPLFRRRDHLREAMVAGPALSIVLVGRSIEKEQGELRQLAITLVVTGAGLLALGLLGGWLLSNRAIRPIRAISATAGRISGSNLSGRIDLAGTDSELGALARVLNDMFGRIEAAFDRQVRFTADASHELRTPLSIIYSNTQLALSKERTVEEYREALATTLRAAHRMKSLVEGLLVLARADAGKLEIKPAPLDLSAIIEDCAELVRPLATERKVAIDLQLHPAEMLGDALRLSQLVTNLLTNAIIYNQPGGRVTVTILTDEHSIRLEVADTGIGVDEEQRKHLFDRFYRADASRSRESGGTGLGLAICRSIVEAHGGEIAFSSEIGVGTTFKVRLPTSVAYRSHPTIART